MTSTEQAGRRRRLFRWVGSESHLVASFQHTLAAELGAREGRLVSLFYGSGSLEQAVAGVAPQLAAEANPELLALYAQLQHDPARVYDALEALDLFVGRTRDGYATIRELAPDQLSSPLRAARFLWLSAMAFNGLWRVNQAGQHNVPPDPSRLARQWPLPSRATVLAVAKSIDRTRFLPDWRLAIAEARPNDVIVSDPPYLGGFASYTARGFGAAEHVELASALKTAAEKGCAIIAFNSPPARALYSDWAQVEEVCRSGRISSAGSRRNPVAEIVACAGLRSRQRVAA